VAENFTRNVSTYYQSERSESNRNGEVEEWTSGGMEEWTSGGVEE
jgi:hypothetical protein